MKLFAITISFFLFFADQCNGNEIFISNRLRLFNQRVNLYDYNNQKGTYTVIFRFGSDTSESLSPKNFSVNKGNVRIFGKNGYIEFLPNEVTVFKTKKMEKALKVQMAKGWQHVGISIDRTPSLYISWATEGKSLNEYLQDTGGLSLAEIYPQLLVLKEKNTFKAEMRIVFSDDFEGNVSKWVINSNWK